MNVFTTVLATLVAASAACVGNVDSLTTFNAGGRSHYYRLPGIRMQAMRFDPPAACRVMKVAVLLAGNDSAGVGRLRVFGYEAGAAAPVLGNDLIPPRSLRKTRSGLQRIEISLPAPLLINSHQFFIAVDSLSEGTSLVTDAVRRMPGCLVPGFDHGSQCVQTEDGRWWTNTHAYGITVMLEYESPRDPLLADITEDAGFGAHELPDCGIACADYDNDGRVDILVGGRLFRNLDGRAFRDVTASVGLSGTPRAHLFIDVNADHRPDILFLGITTAGPSGSVLFVAGTDGTYLRTLPDIPGIGAPTSFSVADVDNDGYPDLFIGQGRDSSGVLYQDRLLLNNRKGGFVDRSALLQSVDTIPRASQGAQWVDVDRDGFPDLFVVRSGKDGASLWRNNGDGTFAALAGPSQPVQLASGNSLGGIWHDYDLDGRPDLLLPQHTRLASTGGTLEVGVIAAVELPLREQGFRSLELRERGVQYGEFRGDAAGADVNNDGLLDLLLTAGAPCRFADFYIGAPGGRFNDATAAAGLLHRSLGPRAVWLDIDDDGGQDLGTLEGGRFRLYRNTIAGSGGYLDVDPGAGTSGVRAVLYADGKQWTREHASGRGLLTQEPDRLHFGVGDVGRLDSLVVYRQDGRRETFRHPPLNGTVKLVRDDTPDPAGTATLGTVRAYPNPFSHEVRVVFRLERSEHVRLEIVTADGRLLAVPVDADREAGVHDAVWDATDAEGEKVPQGRYLYRLRAGTDEASGVLVLQR